MSRDADKVLDTIMLESLAVIAAANGRSLVEELNRAVKTYVENELADHSDLRLLQLAVSGERNLFDDSLLS